MCEFTSIFTSKKPKGMAYNKIYSQGQQLSTYILSQKTYFQIQQKINNPTPHKKTKSKQMDIVYIL